MFPLKLGSVEGRVDVPVEGRLVPIDGRVDPMEGRLDGRELPRLGMLVLGRVVGREPMLGFVGREMDGRLLLGRETLGLVDGFIALPRDDIEEREGMERPRLAPALGREMLRPPLGREKLFPPDDRPRPPPIARTSADVINTTTHATIANRYLFFIT